MKKIDYIELGAILYVPSTHYNLSKIIIENKYPYIKSIVVCFEDSIEKHSVPKALKEFENILNNYKTENNILKIFVRPRNIENLIEILKINNIEKINGFVLPKITSTNIIKYFDLVPSNFYLMPTIESLLTEKELLELKQIFLNNKNNILSIRIGAEDILGALGIIRSCKETYFDNIIMSNYIFELIRIFKSSFNISAPVYPCINNMEILQKECKNEINIGLFNKTTIHPIQTKIVNNLYKVDNDEIKIANSILSEDSVFKIKNRMYEPNPHKQWALNIIKRKYIYG